MTEEVFETPQVIIVEDNVSTNNLLRAWLKLQFRVMCFLDAESTIRLLKPSQERYVFVIDFNMPGDDGIQLKGKIENKFPNSRFILISGLFDSNLLKCAYEAGFDATLPKPFTMPNLTKCVAELLDVTVKDATLANKAKGKE